MFYTHLQKVCVKSIKCMKAHRSRAVPKTAYKLVPGWLWGWKSYPEPQHWKNSSRYTPCAESVRIPIYISFGRSCFHSPMGVLGMGTDPSWVHEELTAAVPPLSQCPNRITFHHCPQKQAASSLKSAAADIFTSTSQA